MKRSKPAADRQAAIEREFDAWAPSYESGRLAPWYAMQAREAIARLDLGNAKRVLDIGCGTGWTLRQLAKDHPRIEFVGIDISSGMIAVARQKAQAEGLANLTFEQADWEAGPKLEGGFDAVLMLSVLHYFADPKAALASAHNLLYDQRQLVVVERSLDRSLLTRIWGALHKYVIKDGVQFVAADALVAMMREVGFADAQIYAKRRHFLRFGKLFTSILIAGGKRDNAIGQARNVETAGS